jgi:uncharacterized membrane protein YbhN (UPF0104 family)
LVANRHLHCNGIDVTEMPLQSPGRGEPALGVLRKAARFCDENLGWNRIGFPLSLTIIGIGVMALVHILRHIKVHNVLEAMLAAHTSDIVWASVFVAGGYFTLTFYDLFALRTIGWRKIPYRVAMLASFTSYSIGHNVGRAC